MSNTKEKTKLAILSMKLQKEYYDHLKEVKMYPHKGQKSVINILNNSSVKRLFLQCSRNFGKSVTDAIDAVFNAGLLPDSKVYIIAPFRTQADEIFYQSNLIDTLIPEDWRSKNSFNATQLRWRFKNNSYIKLDGADNEATVRGYKPTRLYCDEFQDWREDTWQSMEPNLLAYDATVVFSGTPPKIENVYTKQANFIKQRMTENNPRYLWLKRTIWDNPRIPRENIEELRRGFVERGEMDVWAREYEAEFVKSGSSYIFPQFYEDKHVRPFSWMITRIKQGGKDVQYYTMSDPSGTRHATLFIAYNPKTAEAFILDEIVETNYEKLSCGQLEPRIREKERLCFQGAYEDPLRIYDEAARLFAIEMSEYGLSYTPTSKKQNDKSNNISLVRDAFLKERIWIAEHCKNTISDIKGYHTDEKGKIVKELDDCVDNILYFYAESGYTFNIKADSLSREDKILIREGFLKEKLEYFQPSYDNLIEEEDMEFDLWQ